MLLINGEWQAPTPETVMTRFRAADDSESNMGLEDGLVAVLTGAFPPADVAAMLQELDQIYLENPDWKREHASKALRSVHRVEFFIELFESIDKYPHLNPAALLNKLTSSAGIEYLREVFESSEKPPECLGAEEEEEIAQILRDNNLQIPDSMAICPNRTNWCHAGVNLLGKERGPDYEEYYLRCRGLDDLRDPDNIQ